MTSRSGGSFAAVNGHGLWPGHTPATAPTTIAHRAFVPPSAELPLRRVPMIHRVTGPARPLLRPPPSFERTMMGEALK
jgi:hypothetical protein